MRTTKNKETSEKSEIGSQLRIVLDTVIDGVVIIDAKGLIQTVNPAAERIFGYDAQEVMGRSINILMPEPYHSAHDGYIHNYLSTGERKVIGIGREVTGKRKDGATFSMELAVSEIEIGGGRMFIGIVRDISRRKAAEAALAEKNRDLEITAAFERTQSQCMALFSTHFEPEEVFRLILPLLHEIHNFPVSAVFLFDDWQGTLTCAASYGLPEDFRRTYAPGSGLIGQAALERKTLTVAAPQEMPFSIESGLFDIVPAMVIASPITYGERVLGVLALAALQPPGDRERGFIDRLTEQMGVSLNNLNQYHDLKALSEQLKQRSHEIAQKNVQLEQASRHKTEFLANMSHELRTPLNAIIGFSELLKDGMIGEMAPEQTEYLGEIFDSAHHLLSLINDVLDLSKIEAGKMEVFLEPVDIRDLLRNAMSIVREKAHVRRIALDLAINDNVGGILADSRKLKQILFNLLSNAVKFSPDGGRVAVEALRSGDHLVIAVTDTGIGIAEDKISLLFRPFEQLDGSLSRQYEGTGLGLVMVKRLVELHGGHVEVNSKPGEGSCFRFEIPWREPGAAGRRAAPLKNPAPAAAIARVRTEGRKVAANSDQPLILIVEDNAQAAALMSRQIEGAGYRAHIARSGEEGLRAAAELQPDLLVLDILLPDIDGWEIMRRLNEDAQLQQVPVIVVSIVADARRGFDLGAMNVLQKPVHKQVLLNAIERVLEPGGKPGARILVVDDEIKTVQFMTTQLGSAGYVVLEAYGGEQAIEIARREHPDLIILDLMMPKVTGFDVLTTLRSQPATAAIPVIVLTAMALSEEDRRKIDEKVAQIVEKSTFDTGLFLADVGRALARRDAVQQVRQIGAQSDVAPLVLVVENNLDQAKLICSYLEDAGFRVAVASNGREGIEQMQATPPMLIILDLLMPEIDGFTFLEAKAGMTKYANTPVMLLSSAAGESQGSPFSANAVLGKPVQRVELLRVIDSLLPVELLSDTARPKVLLVDDDPRIIKILSSFLHKDRFEVMPALGGADGIELARMEHPDLVVLDLMMPGVNGIDVLAALKGDDSTCRIPVIILTAKLVTREERMQLQNQVAAMAEKGVVSREVLIAEVERILRGFKI